MQEQPGQNIHGIGKDYVEDIVFIRCTNIRHKTSRHIGAILSLAGFTVLYSVTELPFKEVSKAADPLMAFDYLIHVHKSANRQLRQKTRYQVFLTSSLSSPRKGIMIRKVSFFPLMLLKSFLFVSGSQKLSA